MLNELLTGKATLEAPPPDVSPYRQEHVAELSRACFSCKQLFTTRADSTSLHCMTCTVAGLEASAWQSNQHHHQLEQRWKRAESHRKIIAICGAVGLSLALFFIRYQIKKSNADLDARAAGYESYDDYKSKTEKGYPTDEFSQKVRYLTDDVCRCSDVNCARTVQRQFEVHLSNGAPDGEMAERSVQYDAERFGECLAAIEAGKTPPSSY